MAVTSIDPCATLDGATCATFPPEFARLRYFFGQRLGALDFTDEQGYLIGKQRFHNLRAHGAGVLCGLRAERYVFPAGSTNPTSVMLVRRGAALDACGREIVIGFDNCIDVAAWYRAHKGRAEVQAWFALPADQRKLVVAIRYLECPSDPMPAPRDPCACEPGGCEFGRVREGFEMKLFVPAEIDCLERPPLDSSGATLPRESTEIAHAIHRFMNRVVAGDCPEPTHEPWLCLADVLVAFDGAGDVTHIEDPDNSIVDRVSLLQTAMLQEAFFASLRADGNDAFFGAGPRLTSMAFEQDPAPPAAPTSYRLLLGAELAPDGPLDSPLMTSPETLLTVAVHRFEPGFTWTAVAPTVTYEASPSRFVLTWTAAGLTAGRYRLSFRQLDDRPVVDQKMRPLQPHRFARQFQLVTTGGALTLAPTLYP